MQDKSPSFDQFVLVQLRFWREYEQLRQVRIRRCLEPLWSGEGAGEGSERRVVRGERENGHKGERGREREREWI